MTTVYMVTDGPYSDYRVLGIYSTQENAEKACKIYNAENDVDPIELDAMPDAPPGLFAWYVSMDINGDIRHVTRTSCEGHRVRASVVRDFMTKVVYLHAYCWAESFAHAVKIANEWHTRIRAADMWFADRYYTPGEDF